MFYHQAVCVSICLSLLLSITHLYIADKCTEQVPTGADGRVDGQGFSDLQCFSHSTGAVEQIDHW